MPFGRKCPLFADATKRRLTFAAAANPERTGGRHREEDDRRSLTPVRLF